MSTLIAVPKKAHNNEQAVFNLATDKIYTFVNLSPMEALVSAAMLENKEPVLIDETVRTKYRKKVVFGERTYAIDDLVVLM